MRRISLFLAMAILLSLCAVGRLASRATACSTTADLGGAGRDCTISAAEATALASSGDGHVYTVRLQCLSENTGDVCSNPRTCLGPPPGLWYSLFRDGEPIGNVCLTNNDATSLEMITPGMVLHEMKKLTWPTAELTIQPPDHRTLVNLPTIFSTDLDHTQSQTITLLDQSVTIRATPTSWTWHPGDGSKSWTTDWPGATYTSGADVADLNTVTYADAGVTVHPSVDVVYTGRFHVDGLPGWTDIPQTLTLAGTPVDLEVAQAAGVLN
jgi:hypothetical protein